MTRTWFVSRHPGALEWIKRQRHPFDLHVTHLDPALIAPGDRVIGSLPVIVMLLVYMTTPAYIMSLFTTDLGHLILLIAAGLMGAGIYIMRSMINFAI